MRSDHKALLFLAGIGVLGATVRVARAVGAPAVGGNAALERQMQAADSAKRSLTAKQSAKTRRKSTGKAAASTPSAGQAPTNATIGGEHRDYRGRLDMDVATAAQIDSLRGIGPALAKRIVADRMARGPFRELAALRRVKGVSAKIVAGLDSIVSFSGSYKAPVASDTVIVPRSTRKRR